MFVVKNKIIPKFVVNLFSKSKASEPETISSNKSEEKGFGIHNSKNPSFQQFLSLNVNEL